MLASNYPSINFFLEIFGFLKNYRVGLKLLRIRVNKIGSSNSFSFLWTGIQNLNHVDRLFVWLFMETRCMFPATHSFRTPWYGIVNFLIFLYYHACGRSVHIIVFFNFLKWFLLSFVLLPLLFLLFSVSDFCFIIVFSK